MIVYKCDLCGEVRDCVPRQIEQLEYDICSNCWDDLSGKLKGKGRAKADRRTSSTLFPNIIPDLPREPEQPFPGRPPDIIAKRARAN